MQDTFPSPKKGSLRALLQLVLPPSWPQAMTSAFYNYRFDECFLELDINRVAQHVVVFLCLASATQHNDFEIHLHFEIHQRRMYQWFVSFCCWAYSTVWIYYNLLIQLPAGGPLGCPSVSFTNGAAVNILCMDILDRFSWSGMAGSAKDMFNVTRNCLTIF